MPAPTPTPTPTPAAPTVLSHVLPVAGSVRVQVTIANGAITAAQLTFDSSNLQAAYASVDPPVVAALAALIGASAVDVEASIAPAVLDYSTTPPTVTTPAGPLLAAYQAALTDTSPSVPGVDTETAELILQGWTKIS